MDKYYDSTNSLISGILLIILGFVLVFLNEQFYKYVVMIFVYLILLIGIKNFIMFWYRKKKKKETFLYCLFNLVFALILSFSSNLSLSLLPIVIGFYFLLNFALQMISFIIIIRNKDHGSIYKFLLSFAYLIIAIILIFTPLKNMKWFLIASGLYFILLGVNFMYDFITDIISVRYKNRLKRRIRICLPALIEAIIPYRALNYINKRLSTDNGKTFPFEKKKNESDVDMEVLVHVSPNGFNRMGHVDICINDTVISYGNYDEDSRKCFDLFGDGVLFMAPRKKYIPFVIERNEKTLFVFGLKLSEKQKQRVIKQIDKIKSNLVPWYSPYQMTGKKEENDYASALYKKTGAEFYKFKSGSFKTFFVLGNNCCFLADSIIGKSGTDLLKMNGLITPGTYYEYLNKEFMKKSSMVVSRNIYNEKRKGDQYDKKQNNSKRIKK